MLMNKAAKLVVFFLSALSLPVTAVPISSIVTGTGDVVFRETGTATIAVTPVSPLQAGVHDSRVIATAVASATGGTVAYRWSPAGSEMRNGVGNLRVLSGKNRPENRLLVSSVANAMPSLDSSGWYISGNNPGRMDITVQTAAGQQAVAADTYVVSLDAAVWSE